jgi:pyruvoyl-dependent arginine decarboxylase (PvlArgDC)
MSTAKAKKRLRPGELDGLVLAYMQKHEDGGPLTASAIGKGIDRSSGAVANCLVRLAKGKKLRQAKRKPRAYALTETKSK